MGTIHNEAKIGEIAKKVLMPGDPLRAKEIAEKYLTEVKCVNRVRNMFAFTGKYKGEEITVMGSGMGMPSMGIYAYELFSYYGVEKILRIGSCGIYDDNIGLNEIILVERVYTESNFSRHLLGEEKHIAYPSEEMNQNIKKTAEELNEKIIPATISCVECFEGYTKNIFAYRDRLPKDLDIKASEMESYALFETARFFNKKAACILTTADRIGSKDEILSAEDRQKALNNMNVLGLEYLIRKD